MLVQRTASVRGVTSLAPAMLTTKVADANLRSVMISPCRPLFDIKAALIGTLLSVSLLAQPAQPAMAAEGLPSIGMPSVVRAKTFQEASVDVAMDAYPLVKSLKAGPVASLGTKVVSLAATGDSREIIQTIDAGLDAFLSVPPGTRDARHERTLTRLVVTLTLTQVRHEGSVRGRRSLPEDRGGAKGGYGRGVECAHVQPRLYASPTLRGEGGALGSNQQSAPPCRLRHHPPRTVPLAYRW